MLLALLQVDVAAARLRDGVVSTAEADLTSQAYWLSATLALGAFLKVRSHLCTFHAVMAPDAEGHMYDYTG